MIVAGFTSGVFLVVAAVIAASGWMAFGWITTSRRLKESLREMADLANSSQVIEEERQMLELIADGAPLEKVLSTLNLAIERLSPGAMCSVMLLDEETRKYLTLAAGPSLPPDYLKALVNLQIGPEVGACGTAAYRNETVVVSNVATDPKFAAARDFILGHGLHSCWSQPVRDSRNKVLGTFAIYHGYVASPRPEELRMARVAAQLAGNAIERTRAQKALTEAGKRLSLAERVARFGIWEADFTRGSFAISKQLARLMQLPDDRDSLTVHEFEAAIHVEDLPALRAALDPMNAREGTIQHEFRLQPVGGPAGDRVGDNVRWVRSHWRFEMTVFPSERAIGAMIDITQERRMLAESQKARAEAEAAAAAARQAERLEQDRTIILEMVAKDEPLGEIAQTMACAIASHSPRSLCLIRIELADALPVYGDSGPVDGLTPAFDHIEIKSIRQTIQPEPVQDLSLCTAWQDFIAKDFPYRFYRAVPILRNSRLAGAIVSFFGSRAGSQGNGGAFSLNDGAFSRGNEGSVSQMDEYLLESWGQYATLAVERRGLYDQLSFRAQYDPLTTLLNRASLYDRAGAQILRARPGGTSMALLYLDLDRFKDVNDRHGHAAGDKVLQDVSRRITRGIRRTDYAARIGGDEFVVILPGVSDRAEARCIAELLAQSIAEPILFESGELSVGASFGISIAPEDGTDIDTLLSKADDRMYRAKLMHRSPGSAADGRTDHEIELVAEPVAAI